MDLQELFDDRHIPGMQFASVFGSVRPHSVSKYHCHHDSEIFLILAGRGYVQLGAESRQLSAGDLVHLTPFCTHAIRNESDEAFDLVSLYWEDIDAAVAVLSTLKARADVPDHTVVFCPPPTPNGGLHLGHLAGPYLRADMYVRALRNVGKSADLVTGIDDHQSFVVTAAQRLGLPPAELVRARGDEIAAALAAVAIDATTVYRPAQDEQHGSRIRALFDAVASAPAVSGVEVDSPWCSACERSLYHAFARGACPSCGQQCDGEICEACGHPNRAAELNKLVCERCGGAAQMRPEPALLFDLDEVVDRLTGYLYGIEGGGALQLLAQQLISAGLKPYRLTRLGEWGIGVADVGFAGCIIDPWVELALTYLDNAERLGVGGVVSSVTFLGFDNSYYYAVLLPALAIVLSREHLLPTGYVTNFFLHLDGEKFSASRNHAVWVNDLTRTAPADAVRLAALRHSPEQEVGTVSRGELWQLLDDPLLTSAREWLAGFAKMSADGRVPATGAWTLGHREFYRQLCACSQAADSLLLVETFSSRAYIQIVDRLVNSARAFRAAESARRRLAHKQEEARTSVALEYLAAKAFAALVYPVMPDLGQSLWHGLGLRGDPQRQPNWSFVVPGTTVAMPDVPRAG